jgi:6-phosphofructokinase
VTIGQIKENYERYGYAVIVVAEACEYQNVADSIRDQLDVEIKVVNPGFVIRDVEACAYDTILSVKVAGEAFENAQKFDNFVQGGNTKVKFYDYILKV